MPGYEPARFDWARDLTSRPCRSGLAQLWVAARKRGAAPTHLTLCTDASANHHRTAVALVDQWRRRSASRSRSSKWNGRRTWRCASSPASCDLLRFGWSADFVDPEAFLALFTTGHPQNVAGLFERRLRRCDRAGACRPQTRVSGRRPLAAAEQILLQDAVVIPVFHRVSKRLVKPGIEGIAANPLGHLPSRYLRLRACKKIGREACAIPPEEWTERSGVLSSRSSYGLAAVTAAAIACTSAAVRVDSDPMPPLLVSIAAWILVASRALRLKIGAIGPWQLWHFAV